jgi:hypothetical protein
MHATLQKIGRNTLAKNHSLVSQESMSEQNCRTGSKSYQI